MRLLSGCHFDQDANVHGRRREAEIASGLIEARPTESQRVRAPKQGAARGRKNLQAGLAKPKGSG
jgi:hypothetical protein